MPWCPRSEPREAWSSLGRCAAKVGQHRFIRPYTPRTNGKAERFIQTALREWAYVRHYANSEEHDLQLSPWLNYCNFARPHGSLGYAPPISRAVPKGTTS